MLLTVLPVWIERVRVGRAGPLDVTQAVIEVHLAQLRRKLDLIDELHPIETVRSCGYLFTVPRKSLPTAK